MVAPKSPDWIPAGWIEQVKVTNGKKVKYYYNSETGQKFNTKKDLIQYVERVNLSRDEPQQTSKLNESSSEPIVEQNKRSSGRKNKRSSEPEHKEGGSEPMPEEKGRSEPMPEHNEKSSEPMPPAMETDETPEWLPEGWIMEVKVKSGSLRKYKHRCIIMFALLFSYQCHKNRLKIHYLGKESLLGWDLDTPDTILRKESSRFPIEFQLKEGTLGPEDPIPSPCPTKVILCQQCFVDQTSGRKFYSRPQVFEYLKTAKLDSSSQQKKMGNGSVSNADMGELPEGETSLKVEGSDNINTLEGTSRASKPKRKGVGKKLVKKKYYTDPVSGYVFRSQRDALRYLETGETSVCAIKPKKREELSFLTEGTSVSVRNGLKFDVVKIASKMVAGKSPGWLPAGWKEQVKVTNGRKVKCYVEPLTGSKFYSKPQVSEYLKNKKPSMGEFFGGETSLKVEASCNMKTLEGASCTSEQKERGVSKKAVKKVVIERAIPEGLPAGWVKETKIQKRNGIRKDPFYTDPVSGYVFRSVPDALRYLESGNISRCAIKPRKRHELTFLDEETSVKVEFRAAGMKNSVTNKGLEKRQRPTVSADATIPSMAEHSLYHAIEECAESDCSDDPSRSHLPRTEGYKRKLCDRVNEKNGTDQLAVNVGSTSDRKMLINSRKTKKQEAVNLPRRSSKRLMGTKPEMVVSLGLSERDLIAAARNAEAKLLVRSVPQRLETFSGAEIANHVFTGTEAPLDAKQSNRRNKPLKNEAFPEARQGTEEEHEAAVESKILNPVGDSWSDPCLDFAVKILTGTIQIEEETKETNDPSSSPLTRTDGCIGNQCEMVCAENGTVSFPSPDMVEEGKLVENGLGMKRSRKMQINSSKSKNKEAVSLPRRSSKRLAGISPNIAVNFPLWQRVPASAKSGESEAAKQSPEALDNLAHIPEALDNVAQSAPQLFETVEGSKKPIEDQAVQEDQPVRQETEKKNVENPESQFLYPLEDSWSDSCIEFAVKTLTGEIPIEDNIAFQDYFQQLDDTSHTLPDLGLPNSFQTDILSDFDSTGNPVSRTQLLDIPTFLSPGNVDLTVHTDNAPQQPILRGKEEQNQMSTQLLDIPTFLSPGNVDLTVHKDNAPQQPILRGEEEQNQTTGKS
ncbi:hypothetical protein RHMOL_Rhmol07G0110500 [Rhododendron molle]|uniref:Uncharacterized protein n=1 Tax=Rhododendron molle TaxID=49168 RepID=A0ACC0MZB2_RHOML|nr:hypothetical protein RHMOL_Rhmol07G0110500 [Rhododendron molle]